MRRGRRVHNALSRSQWTECYMYFVAGISGVSWKSGREVHVLGELFTSWHPLICGGILRAVQDLSDLSISVDTWILDSVYRRFCILSEEENCRMGKPGVKRPFKSPRAKVDLCQNASGRKCSEVFTNTFRNCMKWCDLAFKNFGRKCWNIL